MNQQNKIALVVFDMAGTTVEDGGQVPAAFSAVLARQGLPISAEEIHALRGMSKRAALAQILEKGLGRSANPDEVNALFADFQRELAIRYEGTVAEVAGAAACFARLRNRGIKTLIVCGVTTEVCVNTTVREANDRGFEAVVVSDATGSYFPEFHRMGLEMVKAQGGIFGWVAPAANVVKALS